MPGCIYSGYSSCKDSFLLNKIISKEIFISINTIRTHKGDSFVLIPDMMAHYKKIIATVMSVPPDTFTFRYKCGKHDKKIGPVTPVKFYRDYCNIKLKEYITVVSDKKQHYNKVLRLPSDNIYSSDVVESSHIDLFNVSLGRFVQLAKNSIINNNAVYFSCDVNVDMSTKHNLFDLELYNYNYINLNYLKQPERPEFIDSTHAMVLCGVDIVVNDMKKLDECEKNNGAENDITFKYTEKIVKWKVLNSWGCKQVYVMTNNYFLKNVRRIAIHIDTLNDNEKELYKLSTTRNRCIRYQL